MHIGYSESIDLDSIAEEIIELGNFCKQSCVNNIIILSFFTKTNLNLSKLVRKRNERLNILCKDIDFHYLSSDNICRNHLVEDGINLNDKGAHILAGNFVNSFNDFIFEEYDNFNNNKFGLRAMDPENVSFNGKYSKILRKTVVYTAQKKKFSTKDFFNKCDQIRSFLRIWSHLLKKYLMENFAFYAVLSTLNSIRIKNVDKFKILMSTCLLQNFMSNRKSRYSCNH